MRLRNEEQYLFYRMYSNDMVSALTSIKILKRYRRPDVRYALLRDITVAYVRPFSKNIGKSGKNELATKNIVPKEMLPLHQQLVNLRMQQFAHTDLTYRQPKTVLWAGGMYYVQFREADYDGLLGQIPEIEILVRSVESRVNDCIAEYERAGHHWNHEDTIRITLPTLDGTGFL